MPFSSKPNIFESREWKASPDLKPPNPAKRIVFSCIDNAGSIKAVPLSQNNHPLCRLSRLWRVHFYFLWSVVFIDAYVHTASSIHSLRYCGSCIGTLCWMLCSLSTSNELSIHCIIAGGVSSGKLSLFPLLSYCKVLHNCVWSICSLNLWMIYALLQQIWFEGARRVRQAIIIKPLVSFAH